MRPLAADDIVYIWEQGQAQNAVQRALTILACAEPQMSVDELVGLNIGARDALLLRLREATFGTALSGFTHCPQCGEPLEFTFSTHELHLPHSELDQRELRFDIDDLSLQLRLPTSEDLLALEKVDLEDARRHLLKHCVKATNGEGESLLIDELSATTVAAIEEQMAAQDAQAEILLAVECAACRHHWQALFDIGSYLWAEIVTQAKRLLSEVHALAWAYGWTEQSILTMSARRRAHYLEMVGS